MEFFLCNKRKLAVKPTIHQNSALSKALLGNIKITDHKYRFWILKIIVFLEDIRYLVKLLDNHWASLSSGYLENISNFEGLGVTLVPYKKSVVYISRKDFLWTFNNMVDYKPLLMNPTYKPFTYWNFSKFSNDWI